MRAAADGRLLVRTRLSPCPLAHGAQRRSSARNALRPHPTDAAGERRGAAHGAPRRLVVGRVRRQGRIVAACVPSVAPLHALCPRAASAIRAAAGALIMGLSLGQLLLALGLAVTVAGAAAVRVMAAAPDGRVLMGGNAQGRASCRAWRAPSASLSATSCRRHVAGGGARAPGAVLCRVDGGGAVARWPVAYAAVAVLVATAVVRRPYCRHRRRATGR